MGGIETNPNLALKIGKDTEMQIPTITAKNEVFSGDGTIINLDKPNSPTYFGFKLESDIEISVESGGLLRNHKTLVRKDGDEITIARDNGKKRTTLVIEQPDIHHSNIQVESNTFKILPDLILLVAIGSVASTAKLFPKRRIMKELRRRGLLKEPAK